MLAWPSLVTRPELLTAAAGIERRAVERHGRSPGVLARAGDDDLFRIASDAIDVQAFVRSGFAGAGLRETDPPVCGAIGTCHAPRRLHVLEVPGEVRIAGEFLKSLPDDWSNDLVARRRAHTGSERHR